MFSLTVLVRPDADMPHLLGGKSVLLISSGVSRFFIGNIFFSVFFGIGSGTGQTSTSTRRTKNNKFLFYLRTRSSGVVMWDRFVMTTYLTRSSANTTQDVILHTAHHISQKVGGTRY